MLRFRAGAGAGVECCIQFFDGFSITEEDGRRGNGDVVEVRRFGREGDEDVGEAG